MSFNRLAVFGLSFFTCLNIAFSATTVKLKVTDLFDMMQELKLDMRNPALTAKICHEKLDGHYKTFYSLTSKNLDEKTFTKSSLKRLIDGSFSSRLELKEKLKRLSIKTEDDKRCLTSVRNIIRVLRYFEDYLIEFNVKLGETSDKKYINLQGGYPEMLVNPSYQFSGVQDLESGDVILSRGNAFTSAAIARIGNVDTQFSHLTFVYEDKECTRLKGKKCLYTTEAHIEVGSVVAPIQTHIDQKNSRTVVFRSKDAALAHEASRYMYEKVKNSKKIIQYDFAMEYKKADRLFCSEVIFDGFYTVSNKTVDIPQNKMKFPAGLIPFLNQMGIKVNMDNINSFETFSPGDIEYDSRFELVAEWRNPSKLKDTRMKDVVLTSMFKWMENLDYRFRIPFFTDLKAKAAWTARHTPFISGLLKDSMPLNMTNSQLNLFITLDKIASKLQFKLEEKSLSSEDFPLTPKEMFDVLEEFRAQDMKTYLHPGKRVKVGKFFRLRKKRSKFHRLFRSSRKKMLELR